MTRDLHSIAAKHGFTPDAVRAAWESFHNSRSMAQFDHPELGGHGQWMPTMLMIGDMFNHDLKARVDNLFRDLAKLPTAATATSTYAPSESESVSLRYDTPAADAKDWHPSNLGAPSSTGSQNQVRYAYFPDSRRLVIDLHGKTKIYDTGPHIISGVSQGQTGNAGSITFTSQLGVMPLSKLREVTSADPSRSAG